MNIPLQSQLHPHLLRWPPAVVCLCLCAGCASYQARPLSAEKEAGALATRSLVDPGLQRFMTRNGATPGVTWTLGDFVLAAWYYHPDMATARAQLASAGAGVAQAHERPEPGLAFAPQYTTNPGGLSPWTLGFALDLPWETSGKRAKRTAVATDQALAARFQLAATAWQVRSRVRSSLLSLWEARESVRLAVQHGEDQAALADLLERRYAAGEIGLAEILPVRIAVGQGQAAVQDARRQEQLAVTAVAQAVGVSARVLADCPVDFAAFLHSPSGKHPGEEQLRQWALQDRPDILAALANYAAAEAALRLEVARQYPDLNLGPGYTWDQGADRWLLGFNLTLPVFNRNRGAIARAEAARAVAKAQFDALQMGILAALESARVNYQASREGEKLAEEVFARQRLRLSSAEVRLHAGEIGRLEWVGARLQYDDAAEARLSAIAQVQAGIGALEDAVQRPFDESSLRQPASRSDQP